MRPYLFFDPWQEQGVSLNVTFESLNGVPFKATYPMKSKQSYYVYYNGRFVPEMHPHVHIFQEKIQSKTSDVVGLLTVESVSQEIHAYLRARITPLNSDYRVILPQPDTKTKAKTRKTEIIHSRIVNNQAEFDIGTLVLLAHKTNEPARFSVLVERK